MVGKTMIYYNNITSKYLEVILTLKVKIFLIFSPHGNRTHFAIIFIIIKNICTNIYTYVSFKIFQSPCITLDLQQKLKVTVHLNATRTGR